MTIANLAYIRNLLVKEIREQEVSAEWLEKELKGAIGGDLRKVAALRMAYDIAQRRKQSAQNALNDLEAQEW